MPKRSVVTYLVVILAVAVPTAVTFALDCSGVETCPLQDITGYAFGFSQTYCEEEFECNGGDQCCQYLWLCELTSPCSAYIRKWVWWQMPPQMGGGCTGYWTPYGPEPNSACATPCFHIGVDEQCYKGTVNLKLRVTLPQPPMSYPEPPTPGDKCMTHYQCVATSSCMVRDVSGN